ncbi:hypothetical protein F4779DRAFT_560217 [Xylariaceae sp. FL0662B]|nr:hypothetical protein F4779DRAFT_560217 [Xylariaceae sp. FL0662B]
MAAFLLSAVLPAALLWIVGATTFPATVEVDLIFPRNDTYAPSTLFPFVFAFRNAALAASLNPHLLLTLWDKYYNKTIFSPTLDLTWTNFSSSEPLYVYTYNSILNETDSDAPETHVLNWALAASNCSNKYGLFEKNGGIRGKAIEFTIQKGAQPPDLVAATASTASCADPSSWAFNVTGTLDVPLLQYDGRDKCAVLSEEQPLVTGNPCALQVGTATASSISAAITATACDSLKQAFHTFMSCPSDKPSDNAAPGRWNTGFTGYMGYTAVFGWLVVAFVAL